MDGETLLHRMLTHEERGSRCIDGFPAEWGLYETLLKTTDCTLRDAERHLALHTSDRRAPGEFRILGMKMFHEHRRPS
jgi:hypothetical protein